MSNALNDIDWIGVDWGTSSLRAWGVDDQGNIKAFATSKAGMGQLEPNQFEDELLKLIDPWIAAGRVTLVICCGMVGAKGGWAEAGYTPCPCAPVTDTHLLKVPTKNQRIATYIIPGVSQKNPPDVMRGEETQIAGLTRQFPGFNGTVCLPGTHSKWVQMDGGQIISFTSFITGELFALLSEQSLLRHSVGKSGWDEAHFQDGVDQAMDNPVAISAELFSLRARFLLQDFPAVAARARLSGLLIGLELAATQKLWLSQTTMLIGDSELSDKYQTALKHLGAQTKLFSGQELVLAGLTHVKGELK